MFSYREKELTILSNDFSIPNSSFNFIFSRRKVGKTTLINNYLKNRYSFYVCFIEMTTTLFFQNLQNSLEKFFDKKIEKIESFEELLTIFTKEKLEEKLVLVFDDFHNLLKVDKNVLNSFYKFWNKELKNYNIQVIISSSICSSDKDDEYIYKKSANIIKLQSLNYSIIKDMLPELDKKELMYVYSAYGTNPQYLSTYDNKKDFLLNIKEKFLTYDSFLFNEGMNILKKDLTDIATYSSILYAIALGNNKIGDIADFLNLKSTYLTRYLQKLVDIMIISKHIPINDDIKKSKFGRYEIEDNFIKFWFCYVYPNYSTLQRGDLYSVISHIRVDFNKRLVKYSYKNHIYNIVSQDPYKFLGFVPKKIGRWWNNRDTQIDIVAYDSKDIIFCDCKWLENEKIEQSYNILNIKSNEFKTTLNKKFIIFSKNSNNK